MVAVPGRLKRRYCWHVWMEQSCRHFTYFWYNKIIEKLKVDFFVLASTPPPSFPTTCTCLTSAAWALDCIFHLKLFNENTILIGL